MLAYILAKISRLIFLNLINYQLNRWFNLISSYLNDIIFGDFLFDEPRVSTANLAHNQHYPTIATSSVVRTQSSLFDLAGYVLSETAKALMRTGMMIWQIIIQSPIVVSIVGFMQNLGHYILPDYI